jgi:hypothetical protein
MRNKWVLLVVSCTDASMRPNAGGEPHYNPAIVPQYSTLYPSPRHRARWLAPGAWLGHSSALSWAILVRVVGELGKGPKEARERHVGSVPLSCLQSIPPRRANSYFRIHPARGLSCIDRPMGMILPIRRQRDLVIAIIDALAVYMNDELHRLVREHCT